MKEQNYSPESTQDMLLSKLDIIDLVRAVNQGESKDQAAEARQMAHLLQIHKDIDDQLQDLSDEQVIELMSVENPTKEDIAGILSAKNVDRAA